jgi:hypothetical protein
MPEAPVLDRPLITGTGSTGAMPPGTGRVEQLIEWIGIAIFVALAASAAVILIRTAGGRPRSIDPIASWDRDPFLLAAVHGRTLRGSADRRTLGCRQQ